MEPSKKSEFISLTIQVLLVRAGDGISTYLATPDLKNELNPIVSVFGFGWSGLFIGNLIIIGITIYLNYFQLTLYNRPVIDPLKVNNSRQYLSMLYYDRPDRFFWSFYRLPRRWKPLLNHMGFVFPRTFIFSGVLIIANNLMGAFQFMPYLTIMSLWKFSWMLLYLIPIVFGFVLFLRKIKL